MTKKLLPAMIGVVLAGSMSAAVADVTLFGHIDTSVDSVDVDGAEDDINLHCNTCSVGFKGSEDLGNGLKAIFKLDFQYNTTERNRDRNSPSGSQSDTLGVETPADSLTDRDQWLGLAGGFGQVRIGTISTVYKSHGAMIDPLYRTGLQGRDRGLQSSLHSGAGEEIQGRATNTFRWDSPDYNGVKFGATYTLDNDKTDGEDDDPYGIGASYSNGNLLVFADYVDNGQAGVGEATGWKVGGKYDISLFSFMGQYEEHDDSFISQDDETTWHVAATASLLGITIYGGYGQGEDDPGPDDYVAWTLALTHNMSKRTMLYVGHSQVDCKSASPGSPCGLVPGSSGEDDKTSIGIKHTF